MTKTYLGLLLEKRLALIFLLLPFTACATDKPSLEERLLVSMSSLYDQQEQETPPSSAIETPEEEGEMDKDLFTKIEAYKARGPDQLRPAVKTTSFSMTEEVSVAADEMPISDFVHYIFSDVFGVNYLVDSKIKELKAPVTLNLHQVVTEHRLFELVKDLLKQHGVSVYEKEGVFYLWGDAKNKDILVGIGSTISDIPSTTGEIQQLIPIKYADVLNLFQFLPKNRDFQMTPSSDENMLLVTGTKDQVEQIIHMVNVIDRPAMRGRYVGTLNLNYWNPSEMAGKLSELLEQEGIPVARQAGKRGVYFNAIDRWGTLIFFAAQENWLERVQYWSKLLDVPVKGDRKQYFLFSPQNSKATDLEESLKNILGFGVPDEISQNKNTQRDASKAGQTPSGAGSSTNRVQTAFSDGDVRVAVDENTNALIIYTTPHRYRDIESLLKRLDKIPVQVLLDATVAEVTLTDSLQYGVEWFIKNTDQEQESLIQTDLDLGSGGLSYSMVTDTGKFQLLMNALAQEDLIKVLFSPRVTVRDGKSASISVGTDIPIVTGEATSSQVSSEGDTGIVRSIQYRSTGVALQVTPSVHAQGVVTLEIYQEVSEEGDPGVSGSPVILNRNISTEVVAGDGQTVLLGGLITENESQGMSKVPILGNIPILGNLFRTTTSSKDRTELVIMITPKIIRSTQQIDEMRDALFESFEYLGRGVERLKAEE
jgi:general secretion pathway protein D